ncbi:unnamed protein product [Macrosiphum euphorbiae]|uniref:CCHC-type domain-containing protein n=1 Tax=Macrosiphum euphorbiae TaxID=13131 RepID=A0AAV0WXQ7_9HEMI|nr:unnamed protein product [Macrosiphum euphorbiae]
MKKLTEEVNYLKNFIKSLKVNDNTNAEPKGKGCSNSNHCCQNTDYGNGNGVWSNSGYNNCLPNGYFRPNNFSPNNNGNQDVGRVNNNNFFQNTGHAGYNYSYDGNIAQNNIDDRSRFQNAYQQGHPEPNQNLGNRNNMTGPEVYKQLNWQNYSNNGANAANYFNGPDPIRRCFNCGSPAHFRNNCPLLASKNE